MTINMSLAFIFLDIKNAAILVDLCTNMYRTKRSWKGDEIFISELSKRKNISNALS